MSTIKFYKDSNGAFRLTDCTGKLAYINKGDIVSAYAENGVCSMIFSDEVYNRFTNIHNKNTSITDFVNASSVAYNEAGLNAALSDFFVKAPAVDGGFNVINYPASGLGDFDVENSILICCGDSTTEMMQSAGSAEAVFRSYRQQGGALSGIAGTINFGGSGYRLENFVNDPIDSAFTGPTLGAEVGIGSWDSWLHKPTGAVSLETAIAWRSRYPSNKSVWSICYGINDLILYAELGNQTQEQIVARLVQFLRKAVTRVKEVHPQDMFILRIPNPMTYAPYNAQFPSSTAYPTFDTDPAATSQALVEKWNQALRETYITVRNEFSRCVVMDTWEDVFGNSNTTLTAATQLPFMGDRVHPSIVGYAALAKEYIRILTPNYPLPSNRKQEAELRAALLTNNAWENWSGYFSNNPRYRLIGSTTLVAIGSNYIDLGISITEFNLRVRGAIYLVIENRAAQQFTTYTASAISSNTRLTGVNLSSLMQTGVSTEVVSIYQDNTLSLIAGDSYIDSLAKTSKEYFTGVVNSAGNGYLRVTLDAVPGRFSTKFRDGLLGGSLVVGGGVNTTNDLSTWTPIIIGAADARNIQFNKTGDWTAYLNKPVAFTFSDLVPSPKAYESVIITGNTSATPSTQTAYAHGLGYTPKRVQILPRSNAIFWQNQAPDATNIYIASSVASSLFDAYVG